MRIYARTRRAPSPLRKRTDASTRISYTDHVLSSGECAPNLPWI